MMMIVWRLGQDMNRPIPVYLYMGQLLVGNSDNFLLDLLVSYDRGSW